MWFFQYSNNVTSHAANCSDVNNDISNGETISSCVLSNNTTSIIDNSNDKSCVASGNPNSCNINGCENDKGINYNIIDNASSSNKSSISSNIACNTIPNDNVPTNVMMGWIRITSMTIMTTMVPLPGMMLLLWRMLLGT